MNSNKCDIPVRYPSRVRWVWMVWEYANPREGFKRDGGLFKAEGLSPKKGCKKGRKRGGKYLTRRCLSISLSRILGSHSHTRRAFFLFLSPCFWLREHVFRRETSISPRYSLGFSPQKWLLAELNKEQRGWGHHQQNHN